MDRRVGSLQLDTCSSWQLIAMLIPSFPIGSQDIFPSQR